MANRTFNNVKLNLTLKTTSTRANLSSSSEDIAVQMGKIQKWYNDFAWSAWNAPFEATVGSGNAVTSIDIIGPNDTDDPTQIGRVSVYKGETFIPRAGMLDIGLLGLGLMNDGSIWTMDTYNHLTESTSYTPLISYHPYEYDPTDIPAEDECSGEIMIGYTHPSDIPNNFPVDRSTSSPTYHHVGNTIISTGYKSYYTYTDGRRSLGPVVPNKTISVVIPAEYDDDNDSWGSDTYSAVWNSFFCSFDGSSQVAFNNQYKDFIGDDTNFLVTHSQSYFKVFSTGYLTGPATYNNKSYTYATDSPGIAFSINGKMGMLQIATEIDDHQEFPVGAPDPGTLIISGGEYTHDTVTPGTPIVERHPDFAWGIHGTSGTVYDLDNLTATKLGTSTVGSSVRPIYLNAGVPTGVTQPTSGAWWSSVPMIDSYGVLEIGRFIDFHATAASTNNYDYRLNASTNTLTFQSVASDYTQIQLTSVGASLIRFATTASGKACSAAKIATYPLNTSGQVMLIESGGNTVIGAGEFASNAYSRKDSTGTTAVGYDNLAISEREDLYLGADVDVHIIANGQSIGTYTNNDYKEWLFNASGELNCPDAINIMKGAAGIRLKDKSGALYAGIWDNGSNLWIGSTQSATTHHVGGTFISTGYDSTNHRGNSSINIVVPNDDNTGYSASWVAIHTGNKSLLADTYVPLAGGSMNNDVALYFPRTSQSNPAGGTKITNQGFNIQVPISTGFARSISLYRGNTDSDWSTLLGSIGFYGSGSATADDVEYFMGTSYSSPWYSFKKTQFTINTGVKFQVLSDKIKITDTNDAGWSLVYKSSVLSMDGQVISCYPTASQYGCGIIIGESTGGLTMVGGGESARALKGTIMDASTTPYSGAFSFESEHLMLSADSSIYFVSGANGLTTSAHTDWTNLKTAVFDADGIFRPTVNNKGYIGSSSLKWAGMYATTFYGALSGSIASATTATTQSVTDSSTKVATTRFAFDLDNRSGAFYNNSWGSGDEAVANAKNNPWSVIAYAYITATGNTYNSTIFAISSTYSNSPGGALLYVRISAKGSVGQFVSAHLKWITSDDYVNKNSIIVTWEATTAVDGYPETIEIPACTLLTSQPTNWSTAYNTYYRWNVATAQYELITDSSAPTWAANTFYQKTGTRQGLLVRIWGKCPGRYDSMHIHPVYEATLSAQQHVEFWTFNNTNSNTNHSVPASSIPTNYRMANNSKFMAAQQTLLYESAASVATSLECVVTDLFFSWSLVYVCIQGMSFGSGSNPMDINFLVPLEYVKNYSNYNKAESSSNPGYYVGEGYNPSNTSTPKTRIKVQYKDSKTIVFTHGSGNRIGTIRIYGVY